VFYLRAKQNGFTLEEMEQIDAGLIIDIFIEAGNDNCKYPLMATQADIDKL
jgi:hypothetical protein